MGDVRVIAVCTANICRSPSTAVRLRSGLRELYPDALVESAGVAAEAGREACDLSAALTTGGIDDPDQHAAAGAEFAQHRSRLLTADQVAAADLILGLDRSHRSEIAKLHPAGRPRAFTLRQAAAAADQVAESLRAGSLPEGAPPLPTDPAEQFAWWVAELDAARAFLPGGAEDRSGALAFDQHDVPDPHVVGYQYHPLAAEMIAGAVDRLLDSLRQVRLAGPAPDSPKLAGLNGV